LYLKKTKTVCIYDSYFNTYGGGEKHVLSLVSFFDDQWEIYLVSETNFDIEITQNEESIKDNIDYYKNLETELQRKKNIVEDEWKAQRMELVEQRKSIITENKQIYEQRGILNHR
jgi:hypothetical protein